MMESYEEITSELLDEIQDFLDNHSDVEGTADWRPDKVKLLLDQLKREREASEWAPYSGPYSVRKVRRVPRW